jgi:hypothetical protein
MSAKDPNKKHYFKTVTVEELRSGVEWLVSNNEPVTLWKKGDDEAAAEEFFPQEFSSENNTITLKQKEQGGFLKSLKKTKLLDASEVFIKISLPEHHLFSTTTLKKGDENGTYKVSLTSEIYKGQQRRNYRLNSSNLIKIKFKIDDQVFDGLDISAGGTSFKVRSDELGRFPKDREFTDCVINMNRKSFEIKRAKVAGIWPQKDDSGNATGYSKIGIAFTEINKLVEEDLFRHISGEARAEEIVRHFQKPNK